MNNRIETHFENLPEAERLELARKILQSVQSPALHTEKMVIGNETCRSADAMETQWRENGGSMVFTTTEGHPAMYLETSKGRLS